MPRAFGLAGRKLQICRADGATGLDKVESEEYKTNSQLNQTARCGQITGVAITSCTLTNQQGNNNMKIRIRLIVSVLIFATALVYIVSRTKAQTWIEQGLSHKDYTLLDTRTNTTMGQGWHVEGKRTTTTFHFDDASLATFRPFLKFGSTNAPPMTIEILKACDVVLKPGGTNGWFLFSPKRPTFSGGLKIEVIMDGRRCFDITADELTVEGLKAP
jgi:hypothetical protein